MEESNMKISIICPIYNAENYIEDLYFNINQTEGCLYRRNKFYFN